MTRKASAQRHPNSIVMLAFLAFLPLAAADIALAQPETVLYSFSGGNDGGNPYSSLTSHGGNLYGTAELGGQFDRGAVFELSPNGSGGWNETVLYSFCPGGGICTDGGYPGGATHDSHVIFDSMGNLYGFTTEGGNSNCGSDAGCGVAFELSPSSTGWTETVLYTFCSQAAPCDGGAYPRGGPVMDTEGNLYGMDVSGVFELSPSAVGWTEKIVSTNPINPPAGLIMDAAGNIFGIASGGLGQRIAFELSPNGKGGWETTIIYTFTSGPESSGALWSPLGLDRAGNLYGTYTTYDGPSKSFSGSVYKLSPGTTGWTEKVIYTFSSDDGATEGNAPAGGLVIDTAGNIYGTTIQGGTYNQGIVFELLATPGNGSYEEQVLSTFTGADGSQPFNSLILDSTGNLYGTTNAGGTSGSGVVFEVSHKFAIGMTATTLGASVGQSYYGQLITLTASVSSALGPPPGTVVFSDATTSTKLGSVTLANGIAAITISSLATGSHSLTAAYQGSTNWGSSTSEPISETVVMSPTSTGITSSLNPSLIGQGVTFTATVNGKYGRPPNGETVTFYASGVEIGTETIKGGMATLTTSAVPAGSHAIKASYGGDVNFKPSYGTVTQVVNKYSTTTGLSSSPNPSGTGQAVTFTVVVKSLGSTGPTGTVTLKDGTTSIGSAKLVAGVVTFQRSELAVGTHAMTAVYEGDNESNKSTSPVLDQVVQ